MNAPQCASRCRVLPHGRQFRRSSSTTLKRNERLPTSIHTSQFSPHVQSLFSLRRRWAERSHLRDFVSLHSAADASISAADAGDSNDSESYYTPEVFPRIRESDPYRVLGLTFEATFEEIQDARNYYYEIYRNHEASREKIEWAFDRLLSEHMDKRKKHGFRAAKLGRRTSGPADDIQPKSIFQRVRDIFEIAVPLTTIVNDGVIYLFLSFWAAGMQYANSDPSGPFVVTLGFCAWRLFDKRQKRTPDGPFFGGSAIWGSLGTTVLAFLIGTTLSFGCISSAPWPETFPIGALGAFLSILFIGFVSIFVK